ncbi:MAG: prephenate dehydrogenase/arogenate dehydrogenase family protein [Candidatus Helarchaeota archaeon]|nr:prephenate dehydrogenase/arogenate dehydrogenase family protein [Candidatus Helarchaeota archaeon]
MPNRWEIAIVGGTGAMGQILTKELKPFGEIIIISRSLEKATSFSKKFGVRAGILSNCNTADIIIVSVPIENTAQTCRDLFKIAKAGALIIDIAAVKRFLEEIKSEIPTHISYISMHPLFGPEGSFSENNVLLVPVKSDNWLPLIQKMLKKLKSTTTVITSHEHDSIMSKLQVAHHFIYLILASYLGQHPISPNFYTRSFKRTLQTFIGIEKDMNAILEIQKENPHAELTRKEISSLMEHFTSLDTSKIQELLSQIDAFKKEYLNKKGE